MIHSEEFNIPSVPGTYRFKYSYVPTTDKMLASIQKKTLKFFWKTEHTIEAYDDIDRTKKFLGQLVVESYKLIQIFKGE